MKLYEKKVSSTGAVWKINAIYTLIECDQNAHNAFNKNREIFNFLIFVVTG